MFGCRSKSYQRIAGLVCAIALVGGGLLAPAAHYAFMLVSPAYAVTAGSVHGHGYATESSAHGGQVHSDAHARNHEGQGWVDSDTVTLDSPETSHRPCDYAALYASASASLVPLLNFNVVLLPESATIRPADIEVANSISLRAFGPRGPPEPVV